MDANKVKISSDSVSNGGETMQVLDTIINKESKETYNSDSTAPTPPSINTFSFEAKSEINNRTKPENIPISIEILNNNIKSNIHVFLYLPEMEAQFFSFKDILGDNNFLGLLHNDNVVYIPKSIADNDSLELLVKTKGYRLKRIKYRTNISHYNVELEPLGILQDTVYLHKKTIKRGERLLSFYEPTTTSRSIEEEQFFYGDCNPIYYSDGGHADPYCAFSDMGSDSKENLTHSVVLALATYSKTKSELVFDRHEELYTELQKGKRISVEIRPEKNGEFNIKLNTFNYDFDKQLLDRLQETIENQYKLEKNNYKVDIEITFGGEIIITSKSKDS